MDLLKRQMSSVDACENNCLTFKRQRVDEGHPADSGAENNRLDRGAYL